MSSLYIGSSGLQSSQNALNTTAHNLSNVDTEGYTRQQVQLSSRSYVTLSVDPKSVANKQYGLGVAYTNVKQVRDVFLDKAYRKESGRSMFYEVSTEALEEVESLLGETNDNPFQTAITDLWTAAQELAKDPASAVTQDLFVQRAAELVERASSVYEGLCSYQDNLNQRIKGQIDTVNQYGTLLVQLNERIRVIEAGGVEHANDLKDARNQILDELAGMANISYSEDYFGNVSVQIEGVDFVKDNFCFEIGVQQDETTGFYTPFWPQNADYVIRPDGTKLYDIANAKVFPLNKEISSDLDTDVGGLKAMLLARGDHRANYTDVAGGSYDLVSQSVVMNIQAEFDQLIHNIATQVNQILADAAGPQTGDVVLADGTVLTGVKYWVSEPDGYLRGADGSPLQLFSKNASEGYQKAVGPNQEESWVYLEEDAAAADSLYSLANLNINEELMRQPTKLSFRLEDGSEDKATAEALKAAFTQEVYTLNPNVQKKTTFVDYYTDLINQVATSGSVYRSIHENQQLTVESTLSAREQIVGVSSDEELSSMIRFQSAYNASSRYINVISQMIEHIINTLGV
ncbi:MAG: flagellar hook-associated protein FlgK [Clostridium sp.]|nr:flagellar hook-associated protein FlgK [Clostridium sp.]